MMRVSKSGQEVTWNSGGRVCPGPGEKDKARREPREGVTRNLQSIDRPTCAILLGSHPCPTTARRTQHGKRQLEASARQSPVPSEGKAGASSEVTLALHQGSAKCNLSSPRRRQVLRDGSTPPFISSSRTRSARQSPIGTLSVNLPCTSF